MFRFLWSLRKLHKLKKLWKEGRQFKAALDTALGVTKTALQDRKISRDEIETIGRAWVEVAKEGSDFWPILSKLRRRLLGD